VQAIRESWGAGSSTRRLVATLLVGGLIVMSLVAAVLVYESEAEDARLANRARAEQAAAIAERTTELSAASLRGGEGVLRRAGPMPERGFRRYARDVLDATRFPSLLWAPRVPARERKRFERALGRPIAIPRPPTRRHPEGDLAPVPRRQGAYLPVRLVHPDERPARNLLGLDVLSAPVRADAVRAARDSGGPMLTTPIADPGSDTSEVIVFDPVYEPGARVRSVTQRRVALRGVLSGSIPSRAIAREVSTELGAGGLEISDGETTFVGDRAAGSDGEVATTVVLGRQWNVWTENAEAADVLPAFAIGAIGLTLALLAGSIFALDSRRQRLLARERDLAARDARTQRGTAQALQEAFLPPSLPEIPGVEGAAVYRAGVEGLQVGGDFYDVFVTGERWTAVIGDVAGKGARAAAVTALVRHTVRAFAELGPAEAVRRVNAALWREYRGETFATLCVVALAPDTRGVGLTLAVAGHPPPLVLRAGAEPAPVASTAALVGAVEKLSVDETELRLEGGDTLLLYTDGLTEARTEAGDRFGEARLRRVAGDQATERLGALLDALLERAGGSEGFPHDDVAMLAIRAVPVESPRDTSDSVAEAAGDRNGRPSQGGAVRAPASERL
jgi:serine phosphatase RsbU (regulator of sigma subunit)/CHASE1-domain containing sensor protein